MGRSAAPLSRRPTPLTLLSRRPAVWAPRSRPSEPDSCALAAAQAEALTYRQRPSRVGARARGGRTLGALWGRGPPVRQNRVIICISKEILPEILWGGRFSISRRWRLHSLVPQSHIGRSTLPPRPNSNPKLSEAVVDIFYKPLRMPTMCACN